VIEDRKTEGLEEGGFNHGARGREGDSWTSMRKIGREEPRINQKKNHESDKREKRSKNPCVPMKKNISGGQPNEGQKGQVEELQRQSKNDVVSDRKEKKKNKNPLRKHRKREKQGTSAAKTGKGLFVKGNG